MAGKDLRIVYMGTPDFAVAPLKALVENGYNVVGVVTVPDKPSGRGLKISQSAVKQYVNSLADDKDKPILFQPDKLRDAKWLADLNDLKADLFIVVAFRMLPEMVWKMPSLGTFNLHASLLPLYRGAAPINWAIINGDTQSGVTTFFLNEQIDKGAIIDQQAIDIAPTDNAGDLHDKLMTIGVELVVDSVNKIASGNVMPIQQIESTDAKRAIAPKIFKDFCKIDWSARANDIYNKIRGLSPYPAAWADFGNGLMVKILASHIDVVKSPVDGTIQTDNKSYLRVACADGWVYVDTIHPAGKRPMSIVDFLRGHSL